MAEHEALTVLVVDDDEAKRYAVAHILKRAKFRVVEAASGSEALRLATEKPDVMVLDVKLPDVSGFEVCRRLKADPETASIPVLQVSASLVQSEDRIHGLESGADAYLTDVIEPMELLATIRALLRARRAEEEAQLAARRWQATFEAIRDGICLLDPAGVVVLCNAAMGLILGKPRDQLVGRPSREMFPLDPTLDDDRSPSPRRVEAVEIESRGRWLDVTFDPIWDDRGNPAGAVCIASDITDRRRMEEELRRRADELAGADRQKDEFLAMLAHELRNPLAPIRNALEVIRLKPDPASADRAHEIAVRQVGHMARLIDDLLDVSRITKGKIQLLKEPVDLAAAVAHAAEAARPMIEACRLRLELEIAPDTLCVEGDPTRLEQVLANLLSNGAKYTEPGGRIVLSAYHEGDEAVLVVRDDGIGIEAAMIPRVFDLFAQADQTLARARGGLGIGLTLVRSIVKMHGGSVSARSDGLGLGSEFLVRLPLLDVATLPEPEPKPEPEPEPKPEPEPDLGPGPAASRRLSILVVDDNVDSATSLARVLTLWGYAVRAAHDGMKAIDNVMAVATDLVLLDIGLPGMSGYQVAESLRQIPGVDGPVLVALTGYGQEEDRRRAREAGFDHHLVKPVDFDELRALLSRYARIDPAAAGHSNRVAAQRDSGTVPLAIPGCPVLR